MQYHVSIIYMTFFSQHTEDYWVKLTPLAPKIGTDRGDPLEGET